MRGVGDVLNLLQGVKKGGAGEFSARCPAHDDKKASLSLTQQGDKILVTCHAGCSADKVCGALGLKLEDLFIKLDAPAPKPNGRKPEAGPPAKIVATYDYTDEEGKPLFQVVRLDPKSFRQRHKNGSGEWTWNLDGVRRVLYNLPLVAGSDYLYIVEGEKDADNLMKAGHVATTSPGGAGAWKIEYAQYLTGKHVVIIPDNDEPGREYARQVASSLQGKGETTVVLLPTGKDISDWLVAGGDPHTLIGMEQPVSVLFDSNNPQYQFDDDSVTWVKLIEGQNLGFRAEKLSEERTGIHGRITVSLGMSILSWSYLNIERSEDRTRLSNLAHGAIKGDLAKTYGKEELRRDLDSFCVGVWPFYQSRFEPEEMFGDSTLPMTFALKPYVLNDGGTIVFAAPGRGKSYTLLLWLVSIDAGLSKFWPVEQQKVLFVNLERSKQSVQRRLARVNLALGLPESRPLATLNARGKPLSEVAAACRRFIARNHVQLLGLDSISRAGYGDLNENQSGNKVVDALSALCPTWVALGHTSRASEEHLFGSVMFDGGADICIRLSSQNKPDDSSLGIKWTVTKQNDTPYAVPEIFALQFDQDGLRSVRGAHDHEYLNLEGGSSADPITQIAEFISGQDSEDATGTQVAHALKTIDRAAIARILRNSGRFIVSRKVKQNVFYAVKPPPTSN